MNIHAIAYMSTTSHAPSHFLTDTQRKASTHINTDRKKQIGMQPRFHVYVFLPFIRIRKYQRTYINVYENKRWPNVSETGMSSSNIYSASPHVLLLRNYDSTLPDSELHYKQLREKFRLLQILVLKETPFFPYIKVDVFYIAPTTVKMYLLFFPHLFI